MIREYEFLRPLSLSLLGQSRAGNPPFGAEGGQGGKPGAQTHTPSVSSEFAGQGVHGTRSD